MLISMLSAMVALILTCAARIAIPRVLPGVRFGSVAASVAAAVSVVAVALPTTAIGMNIARSNAVEFKEFWNGFQTGTRVESRSCERDSNWCVHMYDCDPYTVEEPYLDTEYYTDASGNSKTRSVTRYRTVTKYHSCPYTTRESTYVVESTLGDFTVASHWFDQNPVSYRDRHIPTDVGRGVPEQWATAKARLLAGDPGPVTAIKSYDNYILASPNTILKRYSADIDTYAARGLLPRPASSVYDEYVADKVYVAGSLVVDVEPWRDAVAQLNAALGTDLRGDLHLVIVSAAEVDDKDVYATALAAFWQSPELGRHALSKNGIGVIVAVGSDNSIAWARSFTGMPVGNEAMLQQLNNDLRNIPFDVDTVIGHPVGVLVDGDIESVVAGDGVIAKVLWGPNKFERVCMTCSDPADRGVGYSYLKGEIEPGTGAKALMVLVASILSACVIAAAAAVATWAGGRTRVSGTRRRVPDVALLRTRGRSPHQGGSK